MFREISYHDWKCKCQLKKGKITIVNEKGKWFQGNLRQSHQKNTKTSLTKKPLRSRGRYAICYFPFCKGFIDLIFFDFLPQKEKEYWLFVLTQIQNKKWCIQRYYPFTLTQYVLRVFILSPVSMILVSSTNHGMIDLSFNWKMWSYSCCT